MNGEDIIKAAIAARAAAKLGLRMWGLQGRTKTAPFTCYAKDVSQREAWRAKAIKQGWKVEII